MAHKTCVARHSCNIFICWPYLTWPWPWPLLSTRAILICYLLHHLGSPFAKFGFAAFISPVSGADKAKSNDFDLWPDLDLTWIFYIFNSLKKYSLRAFDCRLAHLTTAAGSRVRRGGGGVYLPPGGGGGGGVRPETPVGRGWSDVM